MGYLWSGKIFKACSRRILTCLSKGSPLGRRIATISTGRPRGVRLVGVKRDCNVKGELTFNLASTERLSMRAMSSI